MTSGKSDKLRVGFIASTFNIHNKIIDSQKHAYAIANIQYDSSQQAASRHCCLTTILCN